MTATTRSLAPAKLNTTVLAVTDVQVNPANKARVIPHSGHLQPTVIVQTGSSYTVTCQAPIKSAYDLIGFAPLKLTALEVQETAYADGKVASGLAHSKWTLGAGATALAIIKGGSVDHDGILFVNIEIFCQSADGITPPLTRSDATALNTLAAVPVLHTMGPVEIAAGTRVDGATGHGFTTGLEFTILGNDGDLYPKVATVLVSEPRLTASYSDPVALIGAITGDLAGGAKTMVLNFRQVDASTGLASATSLSIATAVSRLVPTTISYGQGQVAQAGVEAYAVSSDGSTHPLTVNTADIAP